MSVINFISKKDTSLHIQNNYTHQPQNQLKDEILNLTYIVPQSICKLVYLCSDFPHFTTISVSARKTFMKTNSLASALFKKIILFKGHETRENYVSKADVPVGKHWILGRMQK